MWRSSRQAIPRSSAPNLFPPILLVFLARCFQNGISLDWSFDNMQFSVPTRFTFPYRKVLGGTRVVHLLLLLCSYSLPLLNTTSDILYTHLTVLCNTAIYSCFHSALYLEDLLKTICTLVDKTKVRITYGIKL